MSDDYRAAAHRHFADAKLLASNNRFDNAGHLIGFAGECALKAKMERLNMPRHDIDGHHPNPQIRLRRSLEQRRMTGPWLALAQGARLFANWRVDDRYSADNQVTQQLYESWLRDAAKVITLLGFK